MENEVSEKLLSVLYVVRNEEALIRRSIESVLPIADEVVVLDTGSHDGTISICQSLPKTKILSHSWVHDFSKVRNYALQGCSGDWILWIDADEVLDPRSASDIKEAIRSASPSVSGISVNVVDHDSEGDMSPDGGSFFGRQQVRLFRRIPGIRFEGRVLESVLPTASKTGAIDVIDARIHHFLWRGRGPEYKSLKLKYYSKLGLQIPDEGLSPMPPRKTHPPTRGVEIPPVLVDFEGLVVEMVDPFALPSRPPPPDAVPRRFNGPGKVAVVVCAYNVLESTKKCLDSLLTHTHSPYSLYLVDDGSSDGTRGYMTEVLGHPPIVLPENVGVARARNAGIRAAMTDPDVQYVCLLDNDTILTLGWLGKMLQSMEKDCTIGVMGPVTSSAKGEQNVSSQYPQTFPDQVAKQAYLRTPAFYYTERIDRFCMLVRAEVFRKAGLLDEGYGRYGGEDDDLCYRAAAAGFRVAVANNTFIWHSGGATVKGNKINWHSLAVGAYQRMRKKYNLTADEQDRRLSKKAPEAPEAGSFQAWAGGAETGGTSIVILTCNRLDATRRCLESLYDSTTNFELIVVDNGSTDGTLQYLETKPGIKIIRNERNVGVPKARNQGIRASSCQYVVMMDNDVVVKKGWLEHLMTGMGPKMGVVGIEAWALGGDNCPTKKCFTQHDPYGYIGGACGLFRREVFEKVGLLDEGFSPAYYEDVDLCIRIKEAGYRILWSPTHLIKHDEHSTLIHGQKDFFYQDALASSYKRFAAKMNKEIVVQHELLPAFKKKLKILYLGMYWDYGIKERGTSFEQDNFFPALQQWDRTAEMIHFDFVQLGREHGIPRMSCMLQEAVQKHCPDAMFCVFFNEQSDPQKQVVTQISQTTPTKTIGWFCDSHFRYDNFDRKWIDSLNYNVTTSTAALEWYHRDGFSEKVIKSQWAASPPYRKMDGVAKDVEVSFVGQPHGDRRSVIERVKSAGIPVQVYGSGWEKRLSFQEMILMFNRSRINLNLSNACDARPPRGQTSSGLKQIKGRNFEVPGCGGFLLTGIAENLADYYKPGEEIVTYDSTDDMIDKIRHYLANPAEREKIEAAGYARTMREHTYSHRFNQIFSRAGLI